VTRPAALISLKIVGLAAMGGALAWVAMGPYGNLIFRETIGIGLVGGVLFTLWRDRTEIARRIQARDAEVAVYAFGVVLFAVIGACSLVGGAHDIGALTRP
jgi:hypothetical protein